MEYVHTPANPYAFYNAKDNYGLIEKDESKSKLIICYDKEALKEIKEKESIILPITELTPDIIKYVKSKGCGFHEIKSVEDY